MTCSIIIVNYNTRKLLCQLLQSIAKYFHGVQFEILIVDNASTDGSEKIAAEFNKKLPLTWLANKKNLGFAMANNQAIMQSRGKFVLLLNSDTYLIDSSIVKFIHQIDAMPDVGIAGCRLLNNNRNLQRSCGIRPSLKTELYNKFLLDRLWQRFPEFGSYYLSSEAHNQFQEIDWVTGACMLIRRSVSNQIGGLDENIYMFYEDVDLCLRAKKLGYRIVYSPIATIVHLHGGSWKKNREDSILNDAWSALYFHKKHSGKSVVLFLRVLIFCQNLLRFSIWSLVSLFSNHNSSRARGYAKAMAIAISSLKVGKRFLSFSNIKV